MRRNGWDGALVIDLRQYETTAAGAAAVILPLRLASSSPRRRAMLEDCGWALEVLAGETDESPRPGETPEALVERLARAKLAASRALRPLAAHQWALAADTLVALEDRVLGKPADADDARAMLAGLSGHWHRVCSGVAVTGPWRATPGVEPWARWLGVRDGFGCDQGAVAASTTADGPFERGLDVHVAGDVLSWVTCTRVRLRVLTGDDIDAYVATGEPLDKAGAYAIQGRAARFVERVEGSVTAVIGLPLAELDRVFAAAQAAGFALPARSAGR